MAHEILGGVVRASAGAAVALAVAMLSGGAQAQMSAPGSFAVSPTGAATYTVPIQVPPGVGGIEPKLALVYNSQGGNGLLGVAWSLSGLSVITRCPQTASQDGAAWVGGINYTSTDRYCLDGQRLVNIPTPNVAGTSSGTAGVYGADQTYYSTERESFSRIQSFGSAGTAPLAGPSSFKVWTKSGLIMEYGNSTDAKVLAVGKDAVRVWALNKVSDAKGNTMTVIYNTPDTTNGQYYPVSIVYTANSAASPALQATNAVFFDYDFTRADVSPMYDGGSLIKTMARLTKISTAAGFAIQANTTSASANVNTFTLTYETNSAASRLTQVQTCSASGACLSPTSTNWPADATGWSSSQWSNGNYPATPIGDQCLTGDFNGDGKTDVACYSGNNGIWNMQLSTGSGWTSAPWSGGTYPFTPITPQCVTGDFNGDGKTDITCYSKANGIWDVQLSTGSGWVTSSWAGGAAPYTPIGQQCRTGDFDGDGRTDIACFNVDGASAMKWSVQRSTGSGWVTSVFGGGVPARVAELLLAVQNGTAQAYYLSLVSNKCLLGDFNADGRTDIACYDDNGLWDINLSTGGSFTFVNWSGGNYPFLPIGPQCVPGDFNGDGKTDIACYSGNNGVWGVQLSTGSGWVTTSWNNGTYPATPIANQCLTGDFDGDGKTDITCYSGNNGIWNTQLSTGSGWTTAAWGGGTYPFSPITPQCVPGDFNGDGKTDITCYSGSNGLWNVQLATGSGGKTGQASALSNGLGQVISPQYKPLAQTLNARYTRAATVTLPQVAIAPPWPVVTDVDVSDGLGGTRRTSYWYDSAVFEVGTGRGFLGFNWVQSQDVKTGLTSRTIYRQDFPYVGLVASSGQGTSPATWNNLGQTSNRYSCTDFSTAGYTSCPAQQPAATSCTVQPGKHYLVYADTTDSTGNKDLTAAGQPGAGLPGSHSWQVLDNWGNALCNTTQALNADGSTSAYSKTTTNVYAPTDTTKWFLGRVLKSTATSVAP